MKNIKKLALPLLLTIFSTTALVSCERTVEVPVQQKDNDTYSAVYELRNVSFVKNPNTGIYQIEKEFARPLYDADQVLIYRRSGTNTVGSPIWQSIPVTLYYANNVEFDYGFDFSKNDILIKAGGNVDPATMPNNINNQTFRVVIVPGYFGKSTVDKTNYAEVIRFYNIDESTLKPL